jgi:hypothetical protein
VTDRDRKPGNAKKAPGRAKAAQGGPTPAPKPKRLTRAQIEALMREGAELRRALHEAIKPMYRLTPEDWALRVR